MNVDATPPKKVKSLQTTRSFAPQQPPQVALPEIDLVGPMPEVDLHADFAERAKIAGEQKNLSGTRKVVFFLGRGKTGKTTTVRFLAEKWHNSDLSFTLLDADRTNAVLHQYFESVVQPPSNDDSSIAGWIAEAVFTTIAEPAHVLIDLGGGDTTLAYLIKSFPTFIREVEAIGGSVVACCTLGSGQDDLMPLAKLNAIGFQPTATALLFNLAGLANPLSRNSFAATRSHSLYKTLIETQGAAPILVPVLHQAAEAVEARRITFQSARDGIGKPGIPPMGLFHRFAIRDWLVKMDHAFEPIRSWLE